MILFPAIDLKDGQCVRLKLGEMSQATVFNDDPAAQARAFEARASNTCTSSTSTVPSPASRSTLRQVEPSCAPSSCRCSSAAASVILATVEIWLTKGIRRVILGTARLRDPNMVREACRWFPGRVAVGIDARGGRVAVQGWAETSDSPPSISPAASRTQASPPSSTPTSIATAC
jgi:phosphoribosylformimino-5-aminoimidazole carboxamide ribotide isomerase